ncbi:TetR/AcrR family transcriptional regulator [Sporosarcina koreensis]|uniref:TetR/AcrR family transcriptional regulator C-terminal domain-containing protein n=1 Tax=Sporosarcina koreensis TaxID=334735 RepID=A0ABW0TWD1_9BACL
MSTKIDPRVIRTKAMFEEALLELMEEKDYQKITVMEISERSTLNRATFYLHYYDKDELLEQMLDAALHNLRSSVQVKDIEFKYDSDNPHPIFIRLFTMMIEQNRFYRIMLVQEKVPYFTESVREIIETLVERGTQYMIEDKIEFNVPVDMSIAYITSAYLGVIIWWLKNDMPYTPAYMAKQMTRLSTVGPWVDNPYL